MTSEKIFGYDFEDIQRAQMRQGFRKQINLNAQGDYGADPLGDGTFKMVPSGDVVDFAERNRRLGK